jgi:cell division protein FtsB
VSLSQGTVTASRISVGNNRRRGLLRLVLVGILCLIGAGYISPAYNFYTRTNQISDVRGVNSSLQATHDALSEEKEQLLGGAYIEEVARRDLGLVKPGEQPFIVKDIQQEEAPMPVVEEVIEPVEAAPAEPVLLAGLFPF